MKVEAIHGARFATREKMRQAVFEYIAADYDSNRRHSATSQIGPMAFEALKPAELDVRSERAHGADWMQLSSAVCD